jgi:copper oxidase (laccase) domain-containing protein
MAEEFNAKPERMIAFLGPAIGRCCYEVGLDVVEAWQSVPNSAAANAIRPHGERWTFDLDAANRWLLRRAGLRDDRIESSGICTRCGGEAWFSHRGQGPLTGRFGSIVALV